MKLPAFASGESLTRNARFIKPGLIALIAVDLIALGAFAVRVETVTTTTSTPATPVVVAGQPTGPVPQLPVVPPALPAVDLGGSGVELPAATPTPSTTPTPTPAPTEEPTTGPTDPGPDAVRIARCPIPIKEPTTSGGLQTLIGFAPAFGPFKAEAFAAAAAYQPLLQLLGPILAKYPEIAPKIEPAMKPFLGAFAGLLDQVFALVEPLYGPYRQQILEAEGELAAALAPITQELAASPLGGCIVELQAALVEDTQAPAKAAAKR